MEKIAILDIGSNSVRMDLIATMPEGKFHYLGRFRKLVKLSEGMGNGEELKPVPMCRTIDALKGFAEKIKEEKITAVYAFATAAVRKAKNGEVFCKLAAEKTGIRIRVISGEQEAQYDLMGVLGTLPVENCVVVDTGGGSTEIIGVQKRQQIGKISLPLGAVSLTEHFFGDGETPEAFQNVKLYCETEIRKIEFLQKCGGFPLVGLGGSLAAAALVDAAVSSRGVQLHGYTMPIESVSDVAEKILQTPIKERLHLGIEQGREGTAVCGMLPGLAVGRQIISDKLVICTGGLREGVLFSILDRKEKNGKLEKI